MNDVLTGKVEGRGNLGLASFFRMTLSSHQLGTSIAELNPGKGVDGVVDAVMVRYVASCQPTISSINNGIDL